MNRRAKAYNRLSAKRLEQGSVASREKKGALRSIRSADLPPPHLLVVDDDPKIRDQLERLYRQFSYTVTSVVSAEEAIARLGANDIDLVVSDIKLPGTDGVGLTSYIYEHFPDVPVIIITGFSDIQTAVDVLKMGAVDFLTKPFDLTVAQELTRAALEKTTVFREIRHLRRRLQDRSVFGGMLSNTPEMHRIFEIIRMAAPTNMTILVQGETGTGKELVASAVHHNSPRREGPFITINCAGFPEALLESELFGHEKGAFTSADQTKIGKIELADEGTLFLDEIQSMSLAMQGKLLRVLEDQKLQRLGGTASIHVDMRVVAASNVPLKRMVDNGSMRADFYYRINVIPLSLIPLRERKLDIPLLVHDFVHHHSVARLKQIRGVSPEAMAVLMDYRWPGNIRELQNVLERAIVLASANIIESEDLPGLEQEDFTHDETGIAGSGSLRQWMREQEKKYLLDKLAAAGGNVALTAKMCRIGLRTLSRKIRIHGLDSRNIKRVVSVDATEPDEASELLAAAPRTNFP
jgi:two-component system, NtrC family, response regulator HydG